MTKQASHSTIRGLSISLDLTRLLLGFVFLWAFLDKLFGFGQATPSARAWLNGGSPTTGYLSSVDGTFSTFFNGLAGNMVVDWLFMLGLLGVGLGLILGIAMRISVISGAAMLLMMWLAALPLANNPIIDEHIVYTGILAVLGSSIYIQRLGFGHAWRSLPTVRDNPWLQ